MAPAYDFACDPCATVAEVRRPMRDAGLPVSCPDCGQVMRRLYDLNVPVIFRPTGYSLKPDHPDYWKGFDDPLPQPTRWQRGQRAQKAQPDAHVYG